MKRLAVYGTLRRRGHNFYLMGEAKFLGVDILSGYDMYSLGSYPYIVPGTGNVTVEVYDVDDREFEYIRQMELRAGYVKRTVQTDLGPATVYVMSPRRHEQRRNYGRVDGGDWIHWQNGTPGSDTSVGWGEGYTVRTVQLDDGTISSRPEHTVQGDRTAIDTRIAQIIEMPQE